ncbi:L,D-transpeptidase [Yinghuangia seranimata]|uniref:L,D-transpeptidase n=1 Tax=Yinghuangia seranimata TaxID=408067 RepID=UPI00248AD316|nr:L,D-transpeptidase [Yinghuangia seranimata]MDI2126618.1 L,D-transpeptidase [Yinghuangia seranimata]
MSRNRAPRRRTLPAVAALLAALLAVTTACSDDGGKPAAKSGSPAPAAPGPDAANPPAPGPASPSAPPSSSAPPAKVNKVTIQPSKGQTVGIGMPVSLKFDFPVKGKEARAAVERALKVTTEPAAEGSWGWLTDELGYDRVDWRPKEYWKPGTKVTMDAKLNGVGTGDDRFLVRDYQTTFTIGTARVTTVDVAAKTLTVTEGGTTVMTAPISAGATATPTYNGTMVVLEKQEKVRMNSETVGLGTAYDKDVSSAVRLTLSGTFVHAAPWNAASMGKANLSHGCVGLGDADARKFFDRAALGDIVKVSGSTGGSVVTAGNGFGDWNADYTAWTTHSALAGQ